MENHGSQNSQRNLTRYQRRLALLISLAVMGFAGILGIVVSVINQNTKVSDASFGYLVILVFGFVGVSLSAFGILRVNRQRNHI